MTDAKCYVLHWHIFFHTMSRGNVSAAIQEYIYLQQAPTMQVKPSVVAGAYLTLERKHAKISVDLRLQSLAALYRFSASWVISAAKSRDIFPCGGPEW